MTAPIGPAGRRYLATVLAAVEADLGRDLPAGTTLVPTADRAGSGGATCYPFDGRSAVWCDPALVEVLAPLTGAVPLSAYEFVDRAVGLGCVRRGIGLNRVLDGAPVDPLVPLDGLVVRTLDPDDADDVALVATLRAEVGDDDADDAELDLDDLDPHLVAVLEPAADGRPARVLAFAGARPGDAVPFDDIAVLTHPDARRRGLGLAAVHALVEHRRPSGTPAMYRCEADNVGSARIGERLGFDLVQTIGAVGRAG